MIEASSSNLKPDVVVAHTHTHTHAHRHAHTPPHSLYDCAEKIQPDMQNIILQVRRKK